MQFFLDTANVDDLKPFLETGLIDGITTNPSLIAQQGKKLSDVIKQFCDLVDGPISAEVMGKTSKEMIKEGLELSKINKNVTIKLPLTIEGLKACYALSNEEIMTNVTLCFSVTQALMAAKAGATFISPFIGRLDDISSNGSSLIKDIAETFAIQQMDTLVLAASIRTPYHAMQAAKDGAEVATIPPKVLQQMIHHPLTDKGLEIFEKDWLASQK
ncbi:MAG: fructose-6-phosphate aldolase [Alphaproteobacteria bacterium CG_4_10_14_0_8_um_filter_37_21]|nr:MAG: fructose-6-phosphate aldolase [Alphaproteobacteria bacterium CG_4_10_14_0_8_um_filter_37_21]